MSHIEGGCACGSVRYRLTVPVADLRVAICHCRQCARQAGSYCLALVQVAGESFSVVKGEVALFRSSAVACRGFCEDCGSPLLFKYDDAQHLSVTMASLDGGDSMLQEPPTVQYGCESMSPSFAMLHRLPKHASDVVLGSRQAALGDEGDDGRRPCVGGAPLLLDPSAVVASAYGLAWGLHQCCPFADKLLRLIGLLGMAGPVDARPVSSVADWAIRLPMVLWALAAPSPRSLAVAHAVNLAFFFAWLPQCWDHMCWAALLESTLVVCVLSCESGHRTRDRTGHRTGHRRISQPASRTYGPALRAQICSLYLVSAFWKLTTCVIRILTRAPLRCSSLSSFLCPSSLQSAT